LYDIKLFWWYYSGQDHWFGFDICVSLGKRYVLALFSENGNFWKYRYMNLANSYTK
jgi:hypothetical protein